MESMTFAETLWHAANTEPVRDTDRYFPAGLSEDDLRELYVASRTPRRKHPVDGAGDKVRVLWRDDPEALQAVMRLNTEKQVWTGPVWADIRAENPDWVGLTNEVAFHRHVLAKAPDPAHAAWWIGYRRGQPAYAYLLEEVPPRDVWIQWLVGTDALKERPVAMVLALWDIGCRRICWLALRDHPLMRGRWNRIHAINIREGRYTLASFEMFERPDPATRWWQPV